MQITTYKELQWYIINEKEKLLLLRDSFTNEQILRYFLEKEMVDEYCVKFNNKQNHWWDESYVRKILNTRFLSDLDINDLNKMKTTLELYGERRIVEDYVRLLTYEEAKNLPLEIIKTERDCGYWTMSPYNFISTRAFVFFVGGSTVPGYLSVNYVHSSNAVRPVISLKSNTLKSSQELQSEEQDIKELIKMIYILQNNKINESKWLEYLSKYNKLQSLEGSVDFVVLRNLLAKTLMKAELSTVSLLDLDKYNQYKQSIEESLSRSKKLIKLN